MADQYIQRHDGLYRPHVLCGALGIREVGARGSTHTEPTCEHHDCYKLWVLRSGCVDVTDLDGNKTAYMAPQLLMLCPGTTSKITLYQASEYAWLEFGVRNVPLIPREKSKWGWKYYKESARPPEPVQPGPCETWGIDIPVRLPPELYRKSVGMLNQILGEWWRDELGQAHADALLGQWLVMLVRTLRDKSSIEHATRKETIHEDWRERAERVLCESMPDIITVKHWANRMGVSNKVFRHQCMQAVQLLPKVWMNQFKLSRATDLLITQQCTMHEIAHQCGFTSRESFTRWFKQHTGVPPSEWVGRR